MTRDIPVSFADADIDVVLPHRKSISLAAAAQRLFLYRDSRHWAAVCDLPTALFGLRRHIADFHHSCHNKLLFLPSSLIHIYLSTTGSRGSASPAAGYFVKLSLFQASCVLPPLRGNEKGVSNSFVGRSVAGLPLEGIDACRRSQ